MAWPKKVPILESSDITKGWLTTWNFDLQAKQHCLLGWMIEVFPNNHFKEVEGKLREVIGKRLDIDTDNHDDPIAVFNDSPKHSKSMVAATWNKAMEKLGYTVPCER